MKNKYLIGLKQNRRFLRISVFIFCILFSGQLPAQLWQQVGADIDAPATDTRTGFAVSVSADGNTIAVGSEIAEPAGGFNNGEVQIYSWDGMAWQLKGLPIFGEADSDQSGHSVCLSADGNTVAIGAPFNDGNGTNAGQVRVFSWNGNAWQQLGSDLDGEAADDEFGFSVSLSSDGNILAVGGERNYGSAYRSGHVRVFSWSGNSWSQLGTDIDGEASNDLSGYSVSLSSDGFTVAIGAPDNSGSALYSGQARVYTWNGSTWQQKGADIDGEATMDESAYAVSLSADGNTILIGAAWNDGSFTDAGHARVYEWNGSNWQQKGSDIDGEAANDESGYSVSISDDGNTIAIGADRNDGNGTNAGHVRVYIWNGFSWQQQGTDIDGESTGDASGSSVDLAARGHILITGAPFNQAAGHARVYSCNRYASFNAAPSCGSYTSPSGNYTWNTNGIYTDTIASVSGCDSIISVQVTILPLPAVNVLVADVTCFGGSDGSIDITASGGTPPYSYDWNNGQYITEDLIGLTAGTYTGTLTDSNGCFISGPVIVNQPQPLNVQFHLPVDTSCAGDPAFAITGAVPAGGVYSGTAVVADTFDLSLAVAGYNLISYTYTDANGCQGTAIDSIYVNVCAGIHNPIDDAISFHLYPNPGNGIFYLEFSGTELISELLNANGETIYVKTLNEKMTIIDLTAFAPGIYYLRLFTAEKNQLIPLIYQN